MVISQGLDASIATGELWAVEQSFSYNAHEVIGHPELSVLLKKVSQSVQVDESPSI
jgi:hypothetical protein